MARETAIWCRILVFGVTTLGVISVAAAAAAGESWGRPRSEHLACRTTRAGPCEFLDSLEVLLEPGREGLVLVANFGVLRPDAAGQLRWTCEEALGGVAARVRMAPDGTLFVPGRGIVRHPAAGEGIACTARPSSGAVAGRSLIGVTFDRSGAQVLALGHTPRAVYLSADGGESFVEGWQFADGEEVLELAVAPGDAQVIYAVGERLPGGQLLVSRSSDGGRTFQAAPAGPGYPDGIPLDLLGVHPADPATLFAAVRADNGADEIWRSRDGGRSFARILALPPRLMLSGFTFGATGETLFVGTREQLFEPGVSPAELYRSSNGGASWSSRPSGRSGPRYRCLGFRAGALYACAGGSPNGDDFLLGVSRDDGASWTPVMTTQELAGVEPCSRATCAATTAWLCDTYRLCGAGARLDGGAARDGAGAGGEPPGGCGCALGRPAGGAGAALIGALAALIAARVRR